MKHASSSTFILFFLLMTTMACTEKEADITYVTGNEWDCRYVNTLGINGLSQKLLGEWLWSYRTCWGTGPDKDDTIDKGLKVVFTPDQQVTILKDRLVIASSPYSLKADGTDDFVIETSPVTQLSGHIYFCNNMVVFSDTYKDGCANYFIKN